MTVAARPNLTRRLYMEAILTTKLQNLQQFAKEHPAIPLSTLRWWLFDEGKSGLRASGAALRLGKRIYIDPEKFDTWFAAKVSAERGR